MITFREFFNEAMDEEDYSPELQAAIYKIHQDCGPFLAKAQDAAMWRGFTHGSFEGGDDVLYTRNVRKDRRPRDTQLVAHNAMDAWFEKHMHIKPRSQGLFCSGHLGKANKFGEAALIFPIGEFKYIWASRLKTNGELGEPIKDTAPLTGAIEVAIDQNYEDEKAAEEAVDDRMREWYKFHEDTGLRDALVHHAEVVILCDRYHAIPLTALVKQHLNWYKFYPKVFA